MSTKIATAAAVWIVAASVAAAEDYGPYRWRTALGSMTAHQQTTVSVDGDQAVLRVCVGIDQPPAETACNDFPAPVARRGDALEIVDGDDRYVVTLADRRLAFRGGTGSASVPEGATDWTAAPLAE